MEFKLKQCAQTTPVAPFPNTHTHLQNTNSHTAFLLESSLGSPNHCTVI